jgi:hypothetical protein
MLYYDILSTILYCVEMTKAVDMWSEVAVFAVTVYEGKATIGRMYLLAFIISASFIIFALSSRHHHIYYSNSLQSAHCTIVSTLYNILCVRTLRTAM